MSFDRFGSLAETHKLAVTPPRLQNLCLLLNAKVLPFELGPNVLLEQCQNFVVRNCAGVGEVVDARVFVDGEGDGDGKEVVEERHGVGDVDDAFVSAQTCEAKKSRATKQSETIPEMANKQAVSQKCTW